MPRSPDSAKATFFPGKKRAALRQIDNFKLLGVYGLHIYLKVKKKGLHFFLIFFLGVSRTRRDRFKKNHLPIIDVQGAKQFSFLGEYGGDWWRLLRGLFKKSPTVTCVTRVLKTISEWWQGKGSGTSSIGKVGLPLLYRFSFFYVGISISMYIYIYIHIRYL